MRRIIEAVFENGVLKPLEAVDLEEHQRVTVTIAPARDAVTRSRGLIPASAAIVEEVAASDEFLP